jgi:hypothetical protein
MLSLPSAAEPILMSLSIAFTEPTFQRILVLAVGAILALGRRTVAAMLRAAGVLARGHPSTYHRVFSRAAWALWPLGRVLAQAIFGWLDRPAMRAFIDKMKTEAAQAVYRLRGAVAEFPNAWIKTKIGLRQFRVRGPRKVLCEAPWACLTHNIQQWTRLCWRQPLVAAN